MTSQVMDAPLRRRHRRRTPSTEEDPMTASTLPRPAFRSWTTDLAALLRLDAAVCAVTGLLAAAAPVVVADALGPDVPTAAVRWVAVALVVWAADAALLARGSRRVLRRTALVAGVGNLAWELATVVLVALGAFSTVGAGLALAVAAVAGGLGVLQLRALKRTR
jgi:hypothetical protein